MTDNTITPHRPTYGMGDRCVGCGAGVWFGTGLYANRIPALVDVETTGGPAYLEGWICAECQLEECDHCHKMKLDYNPDGNNGIICEDCDEERERVELAGGLPGLIEEELGD